jgi:hypothetical protein
VKRTILVGLLLGVALAPTIGGQSQGASIEFKLECFMSGPKQASTFRFTIANNGTEATHVVVGRTMSGGSWDPAVRLAVTGNGSEFDGTYAAGTLGPGRTAGAFLGRIDDMVVPLPSGTAYVTDLKADLFGRVEPKRLSGLPSSAEISAVFDAQPISIFNSGMEDLRLLKVWTGKLVSPSIRIPTDCSHTKP